MPDPLDPGAMALAAVMLTASQLRQLFAVLAGHAGSVRIEALPDGHARAVLIGSEGEPVDEHRLFPA